VLDATQTPPGCYSTDHNPDTAQNQTYDCLNVNVYAPILPAGAPPVPVMVWFYGGAFKVRPVAAMLPVLPPDAPACDGLQEGDNMGPFGIYNGSYIASVHNVVRFRRQRPPLLPQL